MNNYTIKSENITAAEFAKCCYDALSQTKIAYLSVDGSDYADHPFEYALKKVVEEDSTFIRAEISAETHIEIKAMIDFFIHCVQPKVCYGVAPIIGPFDSIDIYMAY